MIIYKPYGKAKLHPMRDKVKKLYQKYKDKIELGATAEFPHPKKCNAASLIVNLFVKVNKMLKWRR